MKSNKENASKKNKDVPESPLVCIQKRFNSMAEGTEKIQVVEAYVRMADELDDPMHRLHARWELVWAYALGGDSGRQLPICAEFIEIYKSNPQAAIRPYWAVDITEKAMEQAVFALPQIPRQQCEELLSQMEEIVRRTGAGKSEYLEQAAWYYLEIGDCEASWEYFQKALRLKKDEWSCDSCGLRAQPAVYLLEQGRREEAMQACHDFLESGQSCNTEPGNLLTNFIEDALEQGNLKQAKKWGRRLTRVIAEQRGDDFGYQATLLCLQAVLKDGGWANQTTLERCLRYAHNLWDQGDQFHIYIAAASYCGYLAKKQAQTALCLPPDFPVPCSKGSYSCAELEQWCWREAERIGKAFDMRNGTDGYARKLRLRREAMMR